MGTPTISVNTKTMEIKIISGKSGIKIEKVPNMRQRTPEFKRFERFE
jgi:hypothetical protein